VTDNVVEILVKSRNSTRAGFAGAKADAEAAATGIAGVFERMTNKINKEHLAGVGKGLGASGGILAAGSGLLAMAGPIGAAGIALGAFGAVAVPILGKVAKAHAALTAAQLQYNAATTSAGRATALKAEQQATAGLTGQQAGLMGTVAGLEKSFGRLENQMTPVVVGVAQVAVKLATALMPVMVKLVPVGAKILTDFLVPFTKLLNSPVGVQFFAAVAKFGGQLGTILGPGVVALLGILMKLFVAVMPSGVKILALLLPALEQMATQLIPIVTVAAKVVVVVMSWLAANKLLVPALWLLVGAFIALKLSLLTNPIFLIGAAIAVLAIVIIRYHKQIWDFIVRIWHDIVTFIVRTWNDFLGFARAWWPLLLGPAGLIVKYHTQIWGFIQRIWGAVTGFIKGVWDRVWADAKSAWGAIVRWFSGIPHALVGALTGLGTSLWNFASNAMTMFLSGVKHVWADVKSWFGGLPGAILKALGIRSPPDWAISAGKHVMGGLLKGIAHGATDVRGFFTGLAGNLLGPLKGIWDHVFGGGGTGGGVARWTGDVMKALGMLGEPLSLTRQVLYQMQTESGGNPRAINLTDINAQHGDPSRGLMQVIGATFAAFAGPLARRGIYDPLANIYAAVNYAMHRYGRSLMSGGAGLGSGRGYAAGGPASGWITAGEHGRELIRLPPGSQVYPHGQSQSMLAGAAAISVVLQVGGGGSGSLFDAFMTKWIQNSVRVKGGGNVQAAFGSAG